MVGASASAFEAEVSGTTYDFSVFSGASYAEVQGTLEAQAWWGNASLAQAAAGVVGLTQFPGVNQSDVGPLFVYDVSGTSILAYGQSGGEGREANWYKTDDSGFSTISFAQATVAAGPVPVPEINGGSLPLIAFLLAVVAFGLHGKRQRHSGAALSV